MKPITAETNAIAFGNSDEDYMKRKPLLAFFPFTLWIVPSDRCDSCNRSGLHRQPCSGERSQDRGFQR